MTNTERIRRSTLSELVLSILVKPVGEVIASQASLDLIYCYSKLYLNGAQCSTCEVSMRKYYNELEKTGLVMAEKFDNLKNRTCKPAWNGNKYIPKAARHYSSEYITDDEAVDLLNRGILTANDFDTFPVGYNNESSLLGEQEPKAEILQPKQQNQPNRKRTNNNR